MTASEPPERLLRLPSRGPEAASGDPGAASGGPRASLRHQFDVAKNVAKYGVPEKRAPGPRREAYVCKNHALTTGASTTFHIEVMRKSQRNDGKVVVVAARTRILIFAKN